MAEEAGTAQILEQMNRIEGRFDALEKRLDGRHQQIDIGFPSAVHSLDRLQGEIGRLRRWLVVLFVPIAAAAIVAAWAVLRMLFIGVIPIDGG